MSKVHREGARPVCPARYLLLTLAVAIAACDGETLVDAPPDGDPGDGPAVFVVQPTPGAEVLAGQRVPIRVTASDETGIAEIRLVVRGVVRTTITQPFVPPVTQAVLDTAVVLPADQVGALELQATAVTAGGRVASTESLSVAVVDEDRSRPTVQVSAEVPPRVEDDDTIRVTVTGQDNPGGSGLTELGATLLVDRGGETFAFTRSTTFGATGSIRTSVLHFPVSEFVGDGLPDPVHLRVYGYAVDEAGQCAAAPEGGGPSSNPCADLDVGGLEVRVGNAVVPSQGTVVVEGRTYAAPVSGILSDLVVDTLRRRVYVSNHTAGRIHAFDQRDERYVAEAQVGAQPWGLALNVDGDSLYVANSGGVSLSFIGLAGAFREHQARRFVTQNSPLFEVNEKVALDPAGNPTDTIRYHGSFIDFSDRPQFLAQDLGGRILYSTRPTAAASLGTVRVVDHEPGWESPESRILFVEGDLREADNTVAIANVDSITIFQDVPALNGHDGVEIYDHVPGFPDQRIRSGILHVADAIAAVIQQGSDIVWGRGTWHLERLGFQDTTYVAASGDHRWVAFGEGGTATAGAVVVWDGQASKIHRRLLVADLVANASEQVRGLAFNRDGTLGAARGQMAASFFGTDLRLQGAVPEPRTDGTGVALHPDHPAGYAPSTPSSERTLAFTATGGRAIRILDTVHFTVRGEIQIRDRIVGAMRAGPPLSTDNGGQGRNCSGQDCVVAKLYGLTDSGGIVVLNVRRRHIQPAS